ncbi:MAG: HAD family hydrolase [Actinomycetota bacterium]
MHRGVARGAACLLDVCTTVVSVDPVPIVEELAATAGVGADRWRTALGPLWPAVEDGRLSVAEALRRTLSACGAPTDPQLVGRLVRLEARRLVEAGRVDDGVAPFLAELRDRGVQTALLANGSASTRAMVEEHGLTAMVDELVLSCEVGARQPGPTFYRRALAAVGAEPRSALLVDGRPDHCREAMGLRIEAVVLLRTGWGPDAVAKADGLPSVDRLDRLLPRF